MPGILGSAEASGFLPPILIEIVGSATEFKRTVQGVLGDLKALEAQGQSTAGKLSGTIGKAFAATIGGSLVSLGVEAVHAADQFEVARARLTAMAASQGVAFSSMQQSIDATDAKLAKMGFTNADVESSMARLTQITGNLSEANKNMGNVANFARGAQISLADATNIYGRILSGQGSGGMSYLLTRYVGDMKTATGQAMSSQNVLARVNTLMAAQGAAYAQTMPGKISVMKAEFVNLETELGLKLIPVIEHVASAFGALFDFIAHHKGEIEAVGVGLGALAVPRLAMGVAGAGKSAIAKIGEGLAWARRTPGVVAGKKAATEAEGGLGPVGALERLTLAANAAASALTRLAERGALGGLGGGNPLQGKLPGLGGPAETVAADASQLSLFGPEAAAAREAGQLSLFGEGASTLAVGGGLAGGAGIMSKILGRAKGLGKAGTGLLGKLGKGAGILRPGIVAGEAGAGELGGGAIMGALGAGGLTAAASVALPIAAAVGVAIWRSSSAKHSAQKAADEFSGRVNKNISGMSAAGKDARLSFDLNKLQRKLNANESKGGVLGGLFGGAESYLGVGGGQDRNKLKDEIKDLKKALTGVQAQEAKSIENQMELGPLRDLIALVKQYPNSAGAARLAQDALNASIDRNGNVDQQALQHIEDLVNAELGLAQAANTVQTATLGVAQAHLSEQQAAFTLFTAAGEQMHAYIDAQFAEVDASHQVENSLYSQGQAARALAKAQEESSIQISEAYNSVRTAQIGQQRSVLSVYDAQRTLYQLMGSGTATLEQITNAQLDYQSAQVGVSQAGDQVKQSQIDQKYLMSANGQQTQAVVDAQHSLRDAGYAAADAQHSLNDAIYAANQAAPTYEGNILKLQGDSLAYKQAQQGVDSATLSLAQNQEKYYEELLKTSELIQQYPQFAKPMLDMLNQLTQNNPALAALLGPLEQGLGAVAAGAGTQPAPSGPSVMPNHPAGVYQYAGPSGLKGPNFAGGRASGGPVYPGHTYMVGEQGPEPFTPSVSGYITPHGAGNIIHVHVNQTNASPRDIARAIDWQLANTR